MRKTQPFDSPAFYRLRVKAHLDDQWSDWFEGLTITREPNGETLLCGMVTDQAELHGLLKKVRDLGLGLISVSRVECDRARVVKMPGEKGGVCSYCRRENSKPIVEQNQGR